MPKTTGTPPDATGPVPAGPVASAIQQAVKAAEWITPADAGAVALALKLGADVDRLNADDAVQLAAMSRTLLATLAAIGLTVAGRVSADTPPPAQENPLDALRARAADRLTDTSSSHAATVRPLKGA